MNLDKGSVFLKHAPSQKGVVDRSHSKYIILKQHLIIHNSPLERILKGGIERIVIPTSWFDIGSNLFSALQ